MRTVKTLAAAGGITAAMALSTFSAAAGDIMVVNPHARPSLGASHNSAAFMTLKNTGSKADSLIAASGDVAARVQIHTTINDNGLMKMRPVKAIEIPPGGMAMLKPGGYHIMLIGVKKPLKAGDSFSLKLTFKKAGDMTVTVPVRKIGAGMMMKMDMKKKSAD